MERQIADEHSSRSGSPPRSQQIRVSAEVTAYVAIWDGAD